MKTPLLTEIQVFCLRVDWNFPFDNGVGMSVTPCGGPRPVNNKFHNQHKSTKKKHVNSNIMNVNSLNCVKDTTI